MDFNTHTNLIALFCGFSQNDLFKARLVCKQWNATYLNNKEVWMTHHARFPVGKDMNDISEVSGWLAGRFAHFKYDSSEVALNWRRNTAIPFIMHVVPGKTPLQIFESYGHYAKIAKARVEEWQSKQPTSLFKFISTKYKIDLLLDLLDSKYYDILFIILLIKTFDAIKIYSSSTFPPFLVMMEILGSETISSGNHHPLEEFVNNTIPWLHLLFLHKHYFFPAYSTTRTIWTPYHVNQMIVHCSDINLFHWLKESYIHVMLWIGDVEQNFTRYPPVDRFISLESSKKNSLTENGLREDHLNFFSHPKLACTNCGKRETTKGILIKETSLWTYCSECANETGECGKCGNKLESLENGICDCTKTSKRRKVATESSTPEELVDEKLRVSILNLFNFEYDAIKALLPHGIKIKAEQELPIVEIVNKQIATIHELILDQTNSDLSTITFPLPSNILSSLPSPPQKQQIIFTPAVKPTTAGNNNTP